MLKLNEKNIGNFNLISTFVILIIFAFAIVLLSTRSNVKDFKQIEKDIKAKFLEDKKNEVKFKISNLNLLIANLETTNTKEKQKFIQNFIAQINKHRTYPIILKSLKGDEPYYKKLLVKGELFLYDKNFDAQNRAEDDVFTIEYLFLNREYKWVISTKFEDNIMHKEISLWKKHLNSLMLDNIYVHIALLFFFSIALLLVVYVINKFANDSLDKCQNENIAKEKDLKHIIHKLENALKEEKIHFNEQKKVVQKQSKMLALGEMLGNLSNQWRQPLEDISKVALKLKEKVEKHQITTHEDIVHLANINHSALYLAQTIDDFKVFLKADSLKIDFVVNEIIEKALAINESIIKKNNIKVIRDFDKSIMVHNLSFGLLQALVNILYNSKDALKLVPIDERFIFITTKNLENGIEIIFTDTGRGIPEDIIHEVFKPYFTTKQKTYGTGLGLHMVHNIIVQNMSGKIFVENKETHYRNQTYTGASFTIILENVEEEK